MDRKLLKAVFVDTVPVLTGYLFLGAGFGILLSQAGYGVGWALLMSVCIYAGSGQYLLVSLLTAGASLMTNAVATLLVNVRHVFYGISLVDTYRDVGRKKGYMIFALTDETYSLVTQAKIPQGVDRGSYCFWVSLLGVAAGSVLLDRRLRSGQPGGLVAAGGFYGGILCADGTVCDHVHGAVADP